MEKGNMWNRKCVNLLIISMSLATKTPYCRSFPMSSISGNSGRFLSCEFTHAVYACIPPPPTPPLVWQFHTIQSRKMVMRMTQQRQHKKSTTKRKPKRKENKMLLKIFDCACAVAANRVRPQWWLQGCAHQAKEEGEEMVLQVCIII